MRLIILVSLCSILFACSTAQQVANQTSTLESFNPSKSLGNNQTVVLLHGLSRTSRSLRPMAKALQAEGYKVCNIDYPSRYFTVKKLAIDFVLPRIKECASGEQKLNFVTHSLGGIIVRSLNMELEEFPVGRVVMLSPPNQGSEAVDLLSNAWGFNTLAGPAGASLGTDENSVANTLPIPFMPFGIIAATSSNSPMSWIIPGDDDGKVTLERMRLQGMSDYLEVKTTHSFMMTNKQVIQATIDFLQTEKFQIIQ